MIFTIYEIIDIIVMCVALGYIFQDYVAPQIARVKEYDPIKEFAKKQDFSQFWLAIAVTAPAIILHEFGHKFVALAFGATATFEAAYGFLVFALILKYFKAPFLFFVPAYIAWSGPVDSFGIFWIAIAGPLVNGLLWLASYTALKLNKVPKKYVPFVILTKKINGFLAIFNMIPLFGFDGSHVFSAIIDMLF